MSVRPGTTLTKDPDAVLTYEMDWSDWLGSAAIASSTWTIAGADTDLEQDDDTLANSNQSAQVTLSGGTAGVTYTVTNRITTNETPAQTDDRSFRLKIAQQ